MQIHVIDPHDYPFTKVDNAAILDPELSLYDTSVYVALCSFASNTTSGAYPSMKTLGERAKCSERQARMSIKVLEEKGYITIRRTNGGVNVYTLTRSKRIENNAASETPAHGAEGAAHHAEDPGTGCRRTRLKELDKDFSPTESGEAPPEADSQTERPVELSEVPEIMRPVVKYLLHESGRSNIGASELVHIRALERLHFPARITQEIDVVIERFRRKGRPLASLTFEYLFECLKNQNSRKQRQRASPPAKNQKNENADFDAAEREEVLRRFGGD